MKQAAYEIISSLVINICDLFVRPRALPDGYKVIEGAIDLAESRDLELFLADKPKDEDFEDTEVLRYVPSLKGLVEHPEVVKAVIGYIGKFVRLDYASFSRLSGLSSKSNSGIWHHDSVGNRLKVFLVISDYKGTDVVHTEYIPGTQTRRRLRHRNSVKADGSRLNIACDELQQAKKIFGKKGDIIIFDTNGIHRGVYQQNFKGRDTIQLEFSNILKSSLLRGQVGPRQSTFHNSFKNCNMLARTKPSKDHSYLSY